MFIIFCIQNHFNITSTSNSLVYGSNDWKIEQITEDGEPFAADLPEGSTLKRASPMSPPESQWDTMLQESPAISSSEVSSPSVTPANFDFQKPEPSDPVRYQSLIVSQTNFLCCFSRIQNINCW